jgi:dTDP-4-amino-4,6-dideoxygalactose transaminase
MQIIHAGCKLKFEDREWSGVYKLEPYNIWDGATRWTKGMYVGDDAIQVVSFQIKKRVPIGRGGMILTDSKEAYDWFKYASYDGRNLREYYMDDKFALIGYHMYMTPEDAARGIILMDSVPEENEDTGDSTSYSDLSDREVFKPHIEEEVGFKV